MIVADISGATVIGCGHREVNGCTGSRRIQRQVDRYVRRTAQHRGGVVRDGDGLRIDRRVA